MKTLISPGRKRILKNAGFAVAVPLSVLLVLVVICRIAGVGLFPSSAQYASFLSMLFFVTFTAWAFALNLNSGRMDFSLGATMLLSAIIGGKAALALPGLNFIGMLLVMIAAGCVLGAVSGALYVLLRLPAVITGLGAALIFEAAGFMMSGGMGINIAERTDIMKAGSSTSVLLILLATGLLFMIVLLNFTVFGFNYKALKSGQKIAVNTGLNENSNAMICYIVSGGLMAVAGFYSVCQRGILEAGFGLSTASTAFIALLPIFLGGWLAKRCESQLALVIASIATALLSVAFMQLNVSAAMRSLFNSIILLSFLVYLNNESKLSEFNLFKKIKGLFKRKETDKSEPERGENKN